MFALRFDRLLNTGRDASEWADEMLLPADTHSTALHLSLWLSVLHCSLSAPSLSLAVSICLHLYVNQLLHVSLSLPLCAPLLHLFLHRSLSLCPPLHISLPLSPPPVLHLSPCFYTSICVFHFSNSRSLSLFLLHCSVSLSMPLTSSVALSPYRSYNKYPHILCIRRHISAWLNLKCDVCFSFIGFMCECGDEGGLRVV